MKIILKTKHLFFKAVLVVTVTCTAYAEQTSNTAILKDGTTTKLNGNTELSTLAPNQNIQIHVEPQAWQVRRTEFTHALNALSINSADANAKQSVEKILVAQAKSPGDYTPMEAMDMLGIYYLPREGVRKVMPLIVKEAFLGWFDTLQWASESGKAEIVNNEKFFSRAFQLGGGKKVIDEWLDIVTKNPVEAKKIVDDGLRLAIAYNASEDKIRYDRKWPTAYGLERMIQATGGKPVPPITAPKMEFVEAQTAAFEKITAFYLPIKK